MANNMKSRASPPASPQPDYSRTTLSDLLILTEFKDFLTLSKTNTRTRLRILPLLCKWKRSYQSPPQSVHTCLKDLCPSLEIVVDHLLSIINFDELFNHLEANRSPYDKILKNENSKNHIRIANSMPDSPVNMDWLYPLVFNLIRDVQAIAFRNNKNTTFPSLQWSNMFPIFIPIILPFLYSKAHEFFMSNEFKQSQVKENGTQNTMVKIEEETDRSDQKLINELKNSLNYFLNNSQTLQSDDPILFFLFYCLYIDWFYAHHIQPKLTPELSLTSSFYSQNHLLSPIPNSFKQDLLYTWRHEDCLVNIFLNLNSQDMANQMTNSLIKLCKVLIDHKPNKTSDLAFVFNLLIPIYYLLPSKQHQLFHTLFSIKTISLSHAYQLLPLTLDLTKAQSHYNLLDIAGLIHTINLEKLWDSLKDHILTRPQTLEFLIQCLITYHYHIINSKRKSVSNIKRTVDTPSSLSEKFEFFEKKFIATLSYNKDDEAKNNILTMNLTMEMSIIISISIYLGLLRINSLPQLLVQELEASFPYVLLETLKAKQHHNEIISVCFCVLTHSQPYITNSLLLDALKKIVETKYLIQKQIEGEVTPKQLDIMIFNLQNYSLFCNWLTIDVFVASFSSILTTLLKPSEHTSQVQNNTMRSSQMQIVYNIIWTITEEMCTYITFYLNSKPDECYPDVTTISISPSPSHAFRLIHQWISICHNFCEIISSSQTVDYGLISILEYKDLFERATKHKFKLPTNIHTPLETLQPLFKTRQANYKSENEDSLRIAFYLYIVASIHSLPIFMASEIRFLRTIHRLPWFSATRFILCSPLLASHFAPEFINISLKCLSELSIFSSFNLTTKTTLNEPFTHFKDAITIMDPLDMYMLEMGTSSLSSYYTNVQEICKFAFSRLPLLFENELLEDTKAIIEQWNIYTYIEPLVTSNCIIELLILISKKTKGHIELHDEYMGLLQNPVNLLLKTPLTILSRLFSIGMLQQSLLLLLFKLEMYIQLGPPMSDQTQAPSIVRDHILSLQEISIIQLLIELQKYPKYPNFPETLLCAFIDQLSSHRPSVLSELFHHGFNSPGLSSICLNLSQSEALLPMLTKYLAGTIKTLWAQKDSSDESYYTGLTIPEIMRNNLHPSLKPISPSQRCAFYIKCLVVIICDFREHSQQGDANNSDPIYCAETVNSFFLEALQNSFSVEPVQIFVQDVIPTMSILYYTYPSLAALTLTFINHIKILHEKIKTTPNLASEKHFENIKMLEISLQKIIESDMQFRNQTTNDEE